MLSKTQLRIAQISTVDAPVRQTGSGSIPALVWLLSRELTALGHEVTVFAAEGSEPCGELVAAPASANDFNEWHLGEWINLCRAIEQSDRFDVLHSHGYLWGLPLEPLARAPMVHTLHLWPHRDEKYLWSMMPDACVTAISHCQWSRYPDLKPMAVVHNGVDVSQFTFHGEPDDYVCFLGQFSWKKGPLIAIEAARTLGVRLLLAGPTNEYFSEEVEPLIDGRSVEYVGGVAGRERDQLLGGARALFYPVQEAEPFGLVQVEAMMCGTPVVAMRLGAVPEIVDEGVTGFCVDSAEEFPRAAVKAFALDRRRVRECAAPRFSGDRMAREYLQVYEKLILARQAARAGV